MIYSLKPPQIHQNKSSTPPPRRTLLLPGKRNALKMRQKNMQRCQRRKNLGKIPAKITAAKERAERMFRATSSQTETGPPKHSDKETRLQQITELNSPSAFSSSELLKMLEDQKIQELQGTLRQQQSGH